MKKLLYSVIAFAFFCMLAIPSQAQWTQLGPDIQDRFNSTVTAVSLDGDRLALSFSSSVYVYKWDGTTWVPLTTYVSGRVATGRSVSLSGDYVLIGDGVGNRSYLYKWENSFDRWFRVGQSIPGERSGDRFGTSVSLSDNYFAVGADRNDDNGTSSGHTRVYRWNYDRPFSSANSWAQVGSDIPGERAGDESGTAVSMSGTRVAIGAPHNDANGFSAGHVRVYDWNGSAWIQLGQDIDGEAQFDYSGTTVSLSGNRLAIGAPHNDDNGISAGHVRIYDWDGVSWVQLGQNIEGDAARDQFGYRVSLSGNRLAVAGDPFSNNQSGFVKVYEWNGSSWLQVGQEFNGNPGERLGSAVSLSGERLAQSAQGGSRFINGRFINVPGYAKVFNYIPPPATPIPTVSEWGLIFLFLGFLSVGSAWMYRRKEKSVIA